jgi:hypothetical protein
MQVGMPLAELRAMLRLLLVSTLCLVLAACAGTRVSESNIVAVAPEHVARLRANVDYTGNADYLPRMVQPDAGAQKRVVIRYSHDVSYYVPGENPAQLFNPLLIAGMAKSSDKIVVTGLLEVVKDGGVVRRYQKVLVLDKDKTLFSEGETLSEMRRKGLLLVRDAIDQMLAADEDALRALLAER